MFTKTENLNDRRFLKPPVCLGRLLFLALFMPGLGALATNIEAVVMAYEAATPYVEDGFTVREDNWAGTGKAGQPLLFKHQLFRGNEYWFWAATSFPNARATIGVYDDKGNSISLESFSKDGKSGARILPKKTGTYYVRVTISSNQYEEIDWGLVYGYR